MARPRLGDNPTKDSLISAATDPSSADVASEVKTSSKLDELNQALNTLSEDENIKTILATVKKQIAAEAEASNPSRKSVVGTTQSATETAAAQAKPRETLQTFNLKIRSIEDQIKGAASQAKKKQNLETFLEKVRTLETEFAANTAKSKSRTTEEAKELAALRNKFKSVPAPESSLEASDPELNRYKEIKKYITALLQEYPEQKVNEHQFDKHRFLKELQKSDEYVKPFHHLVSALELFFKSMEIEEKIAQAESEAKANSLLNNLLESKAAKDLSERTQQLKQQQTLMLRRDILIKINTTKQRRERISGKPLDSQKSRALTEEVKKEFTDNLDIEINHESQITALLNRATFYPRLRLRAELELTKHWLASTQQFLSEDRLILGSDRIGKAQTALARFEKYRQNTQIKFPERYQVITSLNRINTPTPQPMIASPVAEVKIADFAESTQAIKQVMALFEDYHKKNSIVFFHWRHHDAVAKKINRDLNGVLSDANLETDEQRIKAALRVIVTEETHLADTKGYHIQHKKDSSFFRRAHFAVGLLDTKLAELQNGKRQQFKPALSS